MLTSIERGLADLKQKLPGLVSTLGDAGYASATGIWAKQVDIAPRAVVHCKNALDVQAAIRIAREHDVLVSVRGGGHDWAGRALCDGIVIDLGGLRSVAVDADHRSATIGGGARAADVTSVTDPLGLAVVAGSASSVGMTGLTLGGGYGPLIGRFGLALDNVIAAEIVLADGNIVSAEASRHADLFWSLRGGGGNFGVVTSMRHRVHAMPSVHSGMLVYPFSEATSVLERCVQIEAEAPEALTVQHLLLADPNGTVMTMVVPTWCGNPDEGEARLEPFLRLGTLLAGQIERRSYGALLSMFDAFIADGLRAVMDTCWLPAFDRSSVEAAVNGMTNAVSPGCAIITHGFRGAASRVPEDATAFGLRRDHTLVEMLATFPDRSDPTDHPRHQKWVRATREAFDTALPGGYPNLLGRDDHDRASHSYGHNARKLLEVKRRYDPENVFHSAIPLPHAT
ncbi:FAD-binding oxidoreductase [Bradyrhizobium sp. BR 10289]|uniref:FAD-binding oxidoreductase n=1 Tax=Bradyrhizobium sp. BR 10289 TaxID=2749993 RepID=UPI001C653792|nr:FAD-binding oxidoreductase [Bradyrhizobium sp. BR 10289]MBW7974010.1 FAD-binding oxidoreductase [Bradyrhizobium sp. BR 10289]